MGTQDYSEGNASFREKIKPIFKGKLSENSTPKKKYLLKLKTRNLL